MVSKVAMTSPPKKRGLPATPTAEGGVAGAPGLQGAPNPHVSALQHGVSEVQAG
jgi:hypothetical protein